MNYYSQVRSKTKKGVIVNAIFCSVILLTSAIVVIPIQIADGHTSGWHGFCFDQTMTALDWLPDTVSWLGPWWKLLAGLVAIAVGILLSLACPPQLAPPPDNVSSLACNSNQVQRVNQNGIIIKTLLKHPGQKQITEFGSFWVTPGFDGSSVLKKMGGFERVTAIDEVKDLPVITKGVSKVGFPVVGSFITFAGTHPLNVIYHVNSILPWADAQGGLWLSLFAVGPLKAFINGIGPFLDFLFGVFSYTTVIAQSDPTAGHVAHPMGWNLNIAVQNVDSFPLGDNKIKYRTTNNEFTKDTAYYRFNVYDIDIPTIEFEEQTRMVEANAHWGFKLNPKTIPQLGTVTPLDGCDPFPKLTPPPNDFLYLTLIIPKQNVTWGVTEHTYDAWKLDGQTIGAATGPSEFSGEDAQAAIVTNNKNALDNQAFLRSFMSKLPSEGDPSIGKASVLRSLAINPLIDKPKTAVINYMVGTKQMVKSLDNIDKSLKVCKKKPKCDASQVDFLKKNKKAVQADIKKQKFTKKGALGKFGGKLIGVGISAAFAAGQGAVGAKGPPTTISMGGTLQEFNQTIIVKDTTPPDILVTGNIAIEVPHGIGDDFTLTPKDRIPAPLVFDVADPFPNLFHNGTRNSDGDFTGAFTELETDSLTGTFPINATTRIAWKAIDWTGNISDEVYQLVTIKTINSNEASIPEGGDVTVLSDVPTIFTLNATNPDDDPVEFFIADNPDDGIIESPIDAVFQNKFQIQGTISRLKGITEIPNNIIFADSENSRIMQMSQNGILSPFFDTSGISSRPEGIAHVSGDIYYISNWDDNTIHKVDKNVQQAIEREVIDVSELFDDPKNISYRDGIIYITDKEGGTISKLIDFPIFDEPIGIANDTSNNILVSDIGSDRIFNFTNDGRFVSFFGGPGDTDGKFNQPSAIAVNSSRIFIIDTGNARVQVFDKSGTFLSEFGSSGINDGQFGSPWGIALNDTQIIVSDNGNDKIQIFDSSAGHVLTIGSNGKGDGEFISPSGVAVNASEIFVADTNNHRIQKINLAKPLVSEDYQSNLRWNVVGSGVSINGDTPEKLNFTNVATGTGTTEHGAKKPISTIPNNAWTAEFDLLTGINTIDSSGFIWMLTNDTDKHPSNDDTIDVLSVYLNSNQLKIFTEHAGVNSTVGGITLNDDTQYFVKFERQAPTQAKLSVFSDEQRTNLVGMPVFHYNIDSELGGLEILQHTNDFSSGGDPLNLVIDNSTIRNVKYSWLGSCESGSNCDTFSSSSKGFQCTEDTCVRSLTPASTQVGNFNNPQGLIINNTHIFVGDSSNNRIQIFNATGSLKQVIGSEGTDDGEFSNPVNIAINNLGDIFVTDKSNDRIQKFNSSGTFIEEWADSLETRFPGFLKQILLSIPDLMADGIDEIPGDRIFVADFTEDKEKIYSIPVQGGNITEFDVSQLFIQPRKIAIDSFNVIYVTDSKDKSISKISATTGLPLGKIVLQNIAGNGIDIDGIFPHGIDIDAINQIYVSDKNQSAIFTLNPAGTTVLDTFNATEIFSNQTDKSIDISQDVEHFYITDDDSDGAKIIKIRKDKGITGTISFLGGITDFKGIEFGDGMSTGKILVANASEQSIRIITPDGVTEQIIDLTSEGIIPDSISPNIQTARLKGSFVESQSGGLEAPMGITFGPDGNLYVTDGNSDTIKRYDGTTKEYLGDFVPENSNGLEGPYYLLFDEDILYVSSFLTDSVKRYDIVGDPLDDALSPGLNTLRNPTGLAIDSKKNLYVSNSAEDNIIILNKTTDRTYFFVETSDNLVSNPNDLAIDQNDNLYVASTGSDEVLKFNKKGELQQTYSDDLLKQPTGIALDTSNNVLYVVSNANPIPLILVFDLDSGILLDTIIENLRGPIDIILGNDGDLFVANSGNSDVLQIGVSLVKIWVADWQTDEKKRIVGLKDDGTMVDPKVIFDLSSVLSDEGHIATDSLGQIYITNGDSEKILVLDGMTGDLNNIKEIDLSNIQISEAIEEFDDEKDSLTEGEFITVQEAKFISIKPQGLAIDSADSLYVSDWENHRIVQLDFDEVFENLFKFNSTFGVPRDIAIEEGNNFNTFYVSDAANEEIVKVQSNLLLEEIRVPTLTTLGGLVKDGNSFLLTDKTSGEIFDFTTELIPIPKIFTQPEGIDVDTITGDIYVTDWDEQRFIQLNEQGVFLDEQVFQDNRFRDYKFLRDIEVDSENIWISDAREARIQKIKLTDPTNDVAPPLLPSDKFLFMSSLAIDSKDNIYVTSTENQTLNKYTERGTLLEKNTDITGTMEDVYASLNQFDNQDYIYVGTTNPDKIYRLDSDLNIINTNVSPLNMPLTLAVDSSGLVYSAAHTNEITKYNDDLSSSSTFNILEADSIYDLFIDSNNSLYAADSGNNTVHKYNLTTGTPIGWLGYCDGGDNCAVNDFHSIGFTCTNATCETNNSPTQPLSFGQFNGPYRLTVDPEQNLYVIDKVYNDQKPYERIQKFSDKGFFIENFFSNSSDTTIKGNFNGAKGIGRGSNFFYVIDTEKIHFYDVNPFSPVTLDKINEIASANVTYKGNSNFEGLDSFKFRVSDGFPPDIPSVTIDITVNPSDADNDGIFDDVDTILGTKSNKFNDGKTSGLIVDSKGQVVVVRNALESEKGVFIQSDALNDLNVKPIFAGCNNATSFALSPFDRVILTCNNPTLEVIRGNIENVNFTDSVGRLAQVDMKVGDKITFDPTIFSFHSELALTESQLLVTFNEVDSMYTLPLIGDVKVDTEEPPINEVCPSTIVLEADITQGINREDTNSKAKLTIDAFLNRIVTDKDNGNPKQPLDPEMIELSHDAPQILPIDVIKINFTAIDSKGNTATCSQEIDVRDTTDPELQFVLQVLNVDTDPNNDFATVHYDSGEIFDLPLVAEGTKQKIVDETSGDPRKPECLPILGSEFTIGETQVTCSGIDDSIYGNVGEGVFQVVVSPNSDGISIQSVTAFDSISDPSPGLSDGDLILVRFTHNTNQPPALTMSQIDDLLIVSGVGKLGTDYVGFYRDSSELIIKINDASLADLKEGQTTFSINPLANLRSSAGLLSSSTSETFLDGDFSKPSIPFIKSFIADDPIFEDASVTNDAEEQSANLAFSEGDTMTIRFSQPTNLAGFGGGILTSNEIDSMFTLSAPFEFGDDYIGQWLDTRTFGITVTKTNTYTEKVPVLGVTKVSVNIGADLKNSAKTSDSSSSESLPLKGSFSNFVSMRTVEPKGAATTTLPSGQTISLKFPSGSQIVSIAKIDDSEQSITISFLGNFINIESINLDADNNIIDENPCEDGCEFSVVFTNEDLERIPITLASVRIFHDANDDGDFLDIDPLEELIPTIVSNEFGEHTATVKIFSLSNIGFGAVITSGGSSSSSPPILKTVSIFGAKSQLEDGTFGFGGILHQEIKFVNSMPTAIIETGDNVKIKVVLYNKGGIYSLEHLSMYTNLRGDDRRIHDSDTYVRYIKGLPVSVADPHGYFAKADVSLFPLGDLIMAEFDLTFAKPMELTDMIFRTWDTSLSSRDIRFLEAIEVIGKEDTDLDVSFNDNSGMIGVEPGVMAPKKPLAEKLFPDDMIVKWAGYSRDSISDSELLDYIGIKGDKIPKWFKEKTGDWVLLDKISHKEFVNALKFFDSIGALNQSQ